MVAACIPAVMKYENKQIFTMNIVDMMQNI